jgi:DNA topoisomerase II
VKHFSSPLEIIKDFYEIRIEFYTKRKKYLISVHEFNVEKLDNELKFILEVVNGTLIFFNRDLNEIIQEMKQKS